MRITETDIALAMALADAAGAAIRPHFRAPFQVEIKEDASPVTIADRAAEQAMRALLAAETPRDGISGEEFGTTEGSTGRQWVLDPIDGTRAFIAGRPLFGTLIALVIDGWPAIGIIDQPILNERWVGAIGRQTLFNGKPATTRTCRELSHALLATTSPALFDDAQLHAFEHLDLAVRSVVLGGDCYNYATLASGWLDLVVEAGLKLHDFAALVPVVEGAGGRMCDWSGDPLTAASNGEVVAAGDPARVEEVLEALACRGALIRRPGYAIAAAIVFLTEVAIALWVHDSVIRPHGGDALAVVLVYLGLRAATPVGPKIGTAIALGIAFAVEAAQWIGLAAMLGLRPHTIGETVLGSSFDIGDLIAYCLGALAILVGEAIRPRRR